MNIIGGLLFVLFIPGYLLSMLLFKKLDVAARIGFSVVFSMVMVVLGGILLTLTADQLGGITSRSVWLSSFGLSVLFVVLLLSRR